VLPILAPAVEPAALAAGLDLPGSPPASSPQPGRVSTVLANVQPIALDPAQWQPARGLETRPPMHPVAFTLYQSEVQGAERLYGTHAVIARHAQPTPGRQTPSGVEPLAPTRTRTPMPWDEPYYRDI
jgi:hypothetical protein